MLSIDFLPILTIFKKGCPDFSVKGAVSLYVVRKPENRADFSENFWEVGFGIRDWRCNFCQFFGGVAWQLLRGLVFAVASALSSLSCPSHCVAKADRSIWVQLGTVVGGQAKGSVFRPPVLAGFYG